jgi:hypothetical protein
LPGLPARPLAPVEVGAVAPVEVGAGAGTTLGASLSVRELIAASAATGHRWAVRVEVELDGRVGSAPLRAPGLRLPRPVLGRRGATLYAVAPTRNESGHLMVSVVPVTAPQLLARLARLARRRRPG